MKIRTIIHWSTIVFQLGSAIWWRRVSESWMELVCIGIQLCFLLTKHADIISISIISFKPGLRGYCSNEYTDFKDFQGCVGTLFIRSRPAVFRSTQIFMPRCGIRRLLKWNLLLATEKYPFLLHIYLIFNFTIYTTIKSSRCKLWFCALAPS